MINENQGMQSDTSVNEKYPHPAITETVEIDQHLDSDFAKKLLTSPYLYTLMVFGLFRFYRKDDENKSMESKTVSFFKEAEGEGKAQDAKLFEAKDYPKYKNDEFLKQGDYFFGCLPEIDGKYLSLYQVKALDLNSDKALIAIELKTPSPTSNLREALITLAYQQNYKLEEKGEKKPSLSVSLQVNPSNPAMVGMHRMIFQQVTHRMKALATDFERCFKEFVIAGNADIERLDNADFYGNPYGINTSIKVLEGIEKVRESFKTHDFVYRILHSSDSSAKENASKGKNPLKEGDSFSIILNNMKLQFFPAKFEAIKEEVLFKIKKCEDNVIELLSNEGICNFHQYGIRFKLRACSPSETAVEISVYYSLSSLLSAVNKGVSMVKSLPTFIKPAKVPDPTLIIYLRMRNMLDATIRHVCRHVTEQLNANVTADIGDQSSLQNAPGKIMM